MTSRNHPNPEALYPVMKRHEVLLLMLCEDGWVSQLAISASSVLELPCAADVNLEELLELWTENGLVEQREVRKNFAQHYPVEYHATRAGKFVVKGWREAGWIE